MFDNPTNLSIIGEDDQCGELVVNMVPTDETGAKNLCEEMDEEEDFEPEYLLDNPFHFNMIIEEAKVPDNFENIFVEYAIKVSEFKTEVFKTDVCSETGETSILNYRHLHSYSNINQQMLEYLMTAKVHVRLFRSFSRFMEIKSSNKIPSRKTLRNQTNPQSLLSAKRKQKNLKFQPSKLNNKEKVLRKQKSPREKRRKGQRNSLKHRSLLHKV